MKEHPPARRLRRILLALTVSTAIGLLAAEGLMRGLLFSEIPILAEAGSRFRFAYKWADQGADPLYWKLRYVWSPPGRRQPRANIPDPLLGWVGHGVAPELYTHQAASYVGNRRPVLLFGDSYAQGVGPSEDLFESLFPSTDAASEYVLVNYGVGGYGLGQIHLLVRESLAHYADRNPVVVLSLLMDDDLNRTLLEFRGWPKPLLHLEDGNLVVVPPTHLDTEEYLADNPPSTPSWVWRFLLRSPRCLPEGWRAWLRGDAEILEQKKRINRAVLEETQAILDAQGVQWFVMLFITESSMNARGPREWEEEFLLELFEELSIPYVMTRPDLWAWAERSGIDRAELYIHEGRGLNHHSRAGNEATLQTILRGLRGDFDPYEFVPGRR